MNNVSKYIWMDGKLVEFDKATVHVNIAALHYGVAVFEGIRAYKTDRGPAVFRLQDHAERLIQSAEIFGYRNLDYTAEDVVAAARETVKANGYDECYIRPLLYSTAPLSTLNIDMGRAALLVTVWEWTKYLGEEAREKGVRANVSSFTRHHPNATMTKAKIAGNYVNSILAKTESTRLGFEEAIMLDPQGYVAECTGENLFLVRRGKIFTPSIAPVLEGITRDSVAEIANDLGYEVIEQPISRDQLYIADEIFVCGTAAEVIGLSEIDFRKIGGGKAGRITREIQTVFYDAIRGKSARYEKWCDYVNG
jgi:branched-chain amino acid aminotransferase